ncbi:MAG: hypothetical protein AAGE52_19605 [Myxococcota bacterium]
MTDNDPKTKDAELEEGWDAEEDQEMLRALGALAREEDEEMRSLDSDPVFGALSAAEREGMTDELASRLGFSDAPEEAPAAPSKKSNVIAFPAIAAVVFAAAAAVALVISSSAPVDLPEYALVSPPPDGLTRGAEDERGQTYSLGRTLEFILRPATRSDVATQVRSYVVEDEGLRAWSPRSERTEGGTWLLTVDTGPEGELKLPAGDWTLVFFVTAEDDFDPSDPGDAQRFEMELPLR